MSYLKILRARSCLLPLEIGRRMSMLGVGALARRNGHSVSNADCNRMRHAGTETLTGWRGRARNAVLEDVVK
jgi:hypothetical protein